MSAVRQVMEDVYQNATVVIGAMAIQDQCEVQCLSDENEGLDEIKAITDNW